MARDENWKTVWKLVGFNYFVVNKSLPSNIFPFKSSSGSNFIFNCFSNQYKVSRVVIESLYIKPLPNCTASALSDECKMRMFVN